MDTSIALATSDVYESTLAPSKPARLVSLDVFRGITIAAMLLVNNPGGPSYEPLEHASWHGWTMTDLIFPFFLFIVGVAIPYSFAKRASQEQSRRSLLGHIWVRALTIFMIGQLLAGSPGLGNPLPDETPTLRMVRLSAYALIAVGVLGFMTMLRWRQLSVGVLAAFTVGVLLLAIATANSSVPPGYRMLKTMRVVCCVFTYTSIMALLIPWPWKRVSTWLPVAICVVFYVLLIAMHYVNRHATDVGLAAKVLGGGMFNPLRVRIPGVLQRIGICYGAAATVALFAGWRTVVAVIVLLCGIYSGLMLGVKLPNHVTGSLTEEDNIARRLDEAVFDKYVLDANGKKQIAYKHTWRDYPDNEGILSTLPAIATALIGVMVGWWLRSGGAPADKCVALLGMGVIVTLVGQLLDWWLMPINKNLWTPSFAVFTAGLGMLTLGTMHWIIDLKGWRLWALPFVIFGMNSIMAFVFQSWVPKFGNLIRLSGPTEQILGTIDWYREYLRIRAYEYLPSIASPQNISLAYAISFVLCVLILLSVMYVCRVFVKA
jgi:predicted acyltransferase